MIRNVHTPISICIVCRNVTLLNQAKISKDGFENHGRLYELNWFFINLVGWGVFLLFHFIFRGSVGFFVWVFLPFRFLKSPIVMLGMKNMQDKILLILKRGLWALSWLIQRRQSRTNILIYLFYALAEMLIA